MKQNLINNSISNFLYEKAKKYKTRIILPEDNLRTNSAKIFLTRSGFDIKELNRDGIDLYVENLSKFKFTKNWTSSMIREYLDDPIHLSCAMVANDEADCIIAGSQNPSSKIIRTAIRLIGIEKSSKWVSSMFLMISSDYKKIFAFSDCAVIPEPDSEQLTNIAFQTAKLYNLLTDLEPKIAFLSFSTNGSANHYRVDKVIESYNLFKKKYPHICCEGEIQVDAALDSKIAQRKNKNSSINGDANILIFPNLDSGNIGYKLVQKMGGYLAWGPLMFGLNKIVHDLSRGCTAEDIVNTTLIASIQSNSNANI
ncbi:MAG: phosphate acetyltransferase [Candidatus Marinimicrobia bacterium]|nr:phosphate acetyltransferase [Candidatus Neomarinimicrobiota bacterium]